MRASEPTVLLLWPAIRTKVLFPVEEGAVGHCTVSTDVANFVAFERIDSNDAKCQAMIAFQFINLLSDPIGYEIEYSCLAKIFRERPCIPAAGKISAAPIPQDNVNRVPLAHILM
jgi:hypothetical protein